jgi:hypothetical protein
MSYFDDNEDRIVYGGRRSGKSTMARQAAEKRARAALAAPPGSALARARTAAHAAFDPLWQSGHFSRGVAYEWLASQLGVPVGSCHMVLFNEAQCRRVVDLCMAHPARAKAAAADFDVLD